MKKLNLAILLLIFSAVLSAETSLGAHLTWDEPTLREDGTLLLLPEEIKGYKIIYGSVPDLLDRSVIVTGLTTDIRNLDNGTWYFAIATIDSLGQIGKFSNTIDTIFPWPPNPPGGFKVLVTTSTSIEVIQR